MNWSCFFGLVYVWEVVRLIISKTTQGIMLNSFALKLTTNLSRYNVRYRPLTMSSGLTLELLLSQHFEIVILRKTAMNTPNTNLVHAEPVKNVDTQIEMRLKAHLDNDAWRSSITSRRNAFTKEGYIKVSDLLPDELKEELRAEARQIVDTSERRIDIRVAETDNTQRKLGSANVRDIREHGSIVPMLYDSPQLRRGLNDIAGHQVLDCDWENERMTMTRQTKPGDTHGWHWGDYQYALIFIVDHPNIDHGGMLQCVPHTNWDKKQPNIFQILTENPIATYFHEGGDIYFFRTDTTLHRTYPLEKEGTRIILNFTYDGPDGAGRTRSHETQAAIYDW